MHDLIHLDTNFLVLAGLPRRAEAKRVERWLSAGSRIRLSAIAWAEFQCGPVSEEEIDTAAALVGMPVAFSAFDAVLAGHLFNAGGRRRSSLADYMIAATAINAGASLATNNAADFESFEAFGLVVETA